MCLVSMVRVVPFPRGKAQQMGAPGLALRVFQAGPHSLLRFFDRQPMPSKARLDCEPAWKTEHARRYRGSLGCCLLMFETRYSKLASGILTSLGLGSPAGGAGVTPLRYIPVTDASERFRDAKRPARYPGRTFTPSVREAIPRYRESVPGTPCVPWGRCDIRVTGPFAAGWLPRAAPMLRLRPDPWCHG